MKTSNKSANKKSSDPFDTLIFEKGLRVQDLIIYKNLDLMIVVLNIGKTLSLKISDFHRLKNASEKELKKWALIGGGVGLHWENLDEDLSLKGFMKTAAFNSVLQNLKKNDLMIA